MDYPRKRIQAHTHGQVKTGASAETENETKHHNAISYRGKYYYRTGSTNQELICFHIRNNNKAIEERKIYSANDCGINCGLNEIQQRIINILTETPDIKTQALADLLGKSKRTVESNISKLKKSGLIKREGAKKTGRWIVKKTKPNYTPNHSEERQ